MDHSGARRAFGRSHRREPVDLERPREMEPVRAIEGLRPTMSQRAAATGPTENGEGDTAHDSAIADGNLSMLAQGQAWHPTCAPSGDSRRRAFTEEPEHIGKQIANVLDAIEERVARHFRSVCHPERSEGSMVSRDRDSSALPQKDNLQSTIPNLQSKRRYFFPIKDNLCVQPEAMEFTITEGRIRFGNSLTPGQLNAALKPDKYTPPRLTKKEQARLVRTKYYKVRIDKGEWPLVQYRALDDQLQIEVDKWRMLPVDKIRLLRYWERKYLWSGVE